MSEALALRSGSIVLGRAEGDPRRQALALNDASGSSSRRCLCRASVEKLLDLSKLQAGRAEPRRDWVSLEDVILAARDSLSAHAADVRLTIDPGAPEVCADAAQIERACANLLENAQRYSSGQPVLIHVRRSGDTTLVRVTDRGPGSADRSVSGSSSLLPRATGDPRPVDGLRVGPRDREWIRPSQWRPDAGIIDLVLPGMDGVELCRRLREWSDVPIIVLSAVGDEDAKVRAPAAGADDYVTKPFGPRELIARLSANLRRIKPQTEETVITADGLEIDLYNHYVSYEGKEIHLTPTEFDLLRLLARNRGRLMTHRSLLSTVWGAGYAEDAQVLRAHIANLRRKLEPADGPRFIRTDPGVGYRFAG